MHNKKLEYRRVTKWGRQCVEARYIGTEWTGWYFLIADEPKAGWIYIPELNVWRCNVSAF
jgi:hypothetical protein